MLEFDDIQHLLLTRAPALKARYEFLSFRDGAGARAWVSAIKETIHSAASMRAGMDKDKRWVTAAFTWNGLRVLGVARARMTWRPDERLAVTGRHVVTAARQPRRPAAGAS